MLEICAFKIIFHKMGWYVEFLVRVKTNTVYDLKKLNKLSAYNNGVIEEEGNNAYIFRSNEKRGDLDHLKKYVDTIKKHIPDFIEIDATLYNEEAYDNCTIANHFKHGDVFHLSQTKPDMKYTKEMNEKYFQEYGYSWEYFQEYF